MAFELNERQAQAAVLHRHHVLVSAGAGTGKTRTVIGRVLYLLGIEVAGRTIAEPVPLARIAAITYTNAAAADLVRKLREALREAGRRDLAWEVDTARVGTIHRFCGEILGEFALRRGGNPTPAVLEEGEGRALADEAARDALIAALEDGSIPNLEDLVARHDGERVIEYVVKLLDEGDVVRRLAGGAGGAGEAGEAGGVAIGSPAALLGPPGAAPASPAPPASTSETALLALACRALDLLEQRLRELGAVDFDRMITWTRDLLRTDEYARDTLRRRVHTLIVDEYQDVDPVQQEIAYLLGDPVGGAIGTRLMLVGDPKQSIYRFRHADVTGWRRVERHFRNGAGEVVRLEENYRSSDRILEFVAATSGRILDTPLDGEGLRDYEVPFAALKVGKPAEQSGGAPVELIVVPPGDNGKRNVDEVRAIEAETVARRARELHDEGVEWGKMAVLVPAWAAADALEAALARQGARVYVMRDEGFLERREVVDLIVALEAVRDPYDDRALFGFLRSPFVGVRDETLFAIADTLSRTPFWPRIEEAVTPESERLRAGVALLRGLVKLRDRVTVDELLADLLDRTGYLAHLALLGETRDLAIANVRKLVRMARGRRQQGVGDFLRDVAAMRERKDRIGDAPLHGEGDDVLTITSIHGAKGLEWDVVFWCDVRRGSPANNEAILIAHEAVALKDRQADQQSALWDELRQHDALETEAERKRLWYVAATRAKRRLVVSALAEENAGKKNRKTAEGWLWDLRATPGFEAQVVRAEPDRAEMSQPPLPTSPPADLTVLAGPVEPIVVPLGRPRHSASEFLAFSRCETKHWFKYILGLREPEINRGSKDFIDAVTRGLIVHDVLERLQEQDELDGLLEDAIGRWDEHAPPPETAPGARYREHMREEISFVATHPEYRAVADLERTRRELGFLHIADDGHFYEGAIDLAAVEPAGLVLLDVKTTQGDARSAEKKALEYRPQRDVYVAAAEAVSGLPVSRFAFQFSRAGVQLGQEITDETRELIAERIRAKLARLGVVKPKLTEQPKECFFCGYKRVGWCTGVK